MAGVGTLSGDLARVGTIEPLVLSGAGGLASAETMTLAAAASLAGEGTLALSVVSALSAAARFAGVGIIKVSETFKGHEFVVFAGEGGLRENLPQTDVITIWIPAEPGETP
jgi:hypothetical protein